MKANSKPKPKPKARARSKSGSKSKPRPRSKPKPKPKTTRPKTAKPSHRPSKKQPVLQEPVQQQQQQQQQQPRRLGLLKRVLLLIGGSVVLIGLSVAASVYIYRAEAERYGQVPVAFVQSMYAVADNLTQRPTTTLVSNQSLLNVLRPTLGPRRHTFVLNTCPSATDAVMKQLQKRSIAVLLDINNTPGPHQCTIAQIVQAYGRPNASAMLTGSLTKPKEILLFYDNGPELSGPLKPVSPPQAPATVVPITLASLPAATCTGKTILSFVAHEDDDLLFMNPDHLHELQNGDCLRTVYLTAGDDGLGSDYWLARETGAEAAYDSMEGHGPSLWIERYVLVNSHEYIKMASPRGNPDVTLIFVQLPDGNLTGNGFPRTHYESLARLDSGAISQMTSVDGQSTYTKSDLTNLLVGIMQYYHPDEIDTQTLINDSVVQPDHSDHIATGVFTTAAYSVYARDVPLVYYTGYPIGQLPENVSGQDLAEKSAAFYAYAAHDSLICKDSASCMAGNGPYPSWLAREYTYTTGTPPIPPAPTPTPTPAAPTTTTTPTTSTTPAVTTPTVTTTTPPTD